MLRTWIVMLAFCLFSNFAWTQTCQDIRHFDSRNATINAGKHDENELKTLFNDPFPSPFSFRLRGGKALDTDVDTSPGSPPPEWQAELVLDRIVHPDSVSWVRLLVIENDHLRGSGTWRIVMAFTCEKGLLLPLFQFSSEGVRLERLDQREIHLYQAIWASTDAHTSPSKHREVVYRWNAIRHRYRRAYASASIDGATWKPDEE